MRAVGIVLLCLSVWSAAAQAGAFKVHPLRLAMEAETKSTTLKVTNTSERPVTVQMESLRWTQSADGRDQYRATDDLLFFPKIVTIERGGEAVVRVAYRGEPPQEERTFRLYLQELPTLGDEGPALEFALRLGVPVFVAGRKDHTNALITGMSLERGAVQVTVANRGSRHNLVREVRVAGRDDRQRAVFEETVSGWYVLPGAQRTFVVPLPHVDCTRLRGLEVSVAGAQPLARDTLPVENARCRAALDGGRS